MPRTLVIGYGNSLRGDDALGPMAVERLQTLQADAEFVSCHQLSPELAVRLAECALALFVDAACEGEPGTVRVQHLLPAGEDAGLTHHVAPSTLLELAQTLYGRTPHAMLVTGTGAAFENHEGFSQQGREALEEICRLVPELIRDFFAVE